MKISVVGTSHDGYIASKEEFDTLSGHAAGICYAKGTMEELFNEPIEKTVKRAASTKARGHHSVYGHPHINLLLEGIPKGLAMVLNNEGIYNTSERSGRYVDKLNSREAGIYTKTVLKTGEAILYAKWLDIYKGLIKEEYQAKYPQFFTDGKVEKLALENARYLVSVFTPASMEYTVSYQQLNYIYGMLQREINNPRNDFMKALVPAMTDFCKALDNTNYIDPEIAMGADVKNRQLALVTRRETENYFGDVYNVNYLGTFAQFAQAQRHRTGRYSFTLLDEPTFYVPPIIARSKELTRQWLDDCEKQASEFPQGMMIKINENGNFDSFILKMKERKCAMAQVEIDKQTQNLAMQYWRELEAKKHPLADELKEYLHGSRCTFPDYKCEKPCGFKEGVTGERII